MEVNGEEISISFALHFVKVERSFRQSSIISSSQLEDGSAQFRISRDLVLKIPGFFHWVIRGILRLGKTEKLKRECWFSAALGTNTALQSLVWLVTHDSPTMVVSLITHSRF